VVRAVVGDLANIILMPGILIRRRPIGILVAGILGMARFRRLTRRFPHGFARKVFWLVSSDVTSRINPSGVAFEIGLDEGIRIQAEIVAPVGTLVDAVI
jgi:hypothetical protein